MTLNKTIQSRLQFLTRVTRKQCQHLLDTDQRFFEHPFTLERAQQLEVDTELADFKQRLKYQLSSEFHQKEEMPKQQKIRLPDPKFH